MYSDYYGRAIYELLNGDIKTLLNNIYTTLVALLGVSEGIMTISQTISTYSSHIAVFTLMLVLFYVGFKFLRIRSRTI